MWDVQTGGEALTLKGHTGHVNSVAFSPDGRWLASASTDGTVKVWDGTELTPELLVEREARSVLEFLCAKQLAKDMVIDAIREDLTINEAVRQRALAWAGPYWERFFAADAERVVEPLFKKLLLDTDLRGRSVACFAFAPAEITRQVGQPNRVGCNVAT